MVTLLVDCLGPSQETPACLPSVLVSAPMSVLYLMPQTDGSFGETLPLLLKVPLLLLKQPPLLLEPLLLLQCVAVVQQCCRLLIAGGAQLLLRTHRERPHKHAKARTNASF